MTKSHAWVVLGYDQHLSSTHASRVGSMCQCAVCGASERIGIHSHQERRYICHSCGQTFAETKGTPLYGLKYPLWQVVIVLTLLAFGCPVPAIVAAFGVDERTVATLAEQGGPARQSPARTRRRSRSGGTWARCKLMSLDVKTQCGTVWVATAISVFSWLFLWGAIAPQRDEKLVTQVVAHVRRCAEPGQPILGRWMASKPGPPPCSRSSETRSTPAGQGGPAAHVAHLHIVQVVKQYSQRHISGIERRLRHGCLARAQAIMLMTQVGWGLINTAYVERFNATWRTWLPALTRRSRTPARVRRTWKPHCSGPAASTTSAAATPHWMAHRRWPPI